MYKRTIPFILMILLALTAFVSANEIIPRPGADVDPDANISWPPPVYVLRGEIELIGSANLENMTNYFIEFRPLDFETAAEALDEEDLPDAEEPFESPWFPVTLPSNQPVVDDVLGTWNTETTADGLYEIRLTLNRQGQAAQYFVVSPLRVENDPPDFVVDLPATATPVAGPTQPTRPTLAASPTALDTTPRVVANTTANVRSGDSTGYSSIATLRANQQALVIGISSAGSGWYYIELQDGTRGWVAPSVVTASGNIRSVPRVNPPFTPTPPATDTPVPRANLAGSTPALTPSQPICNQQFQVLANITNNGSARTNSSAQVLIQNIHVASGQVQAEAIRAIPQLDPGQNYVVGADFTISTFYNEEHRIVVTIDVNNEVIETDTSDNVLTTTYVLQQGGCP